MTKCKRLGKDCGEEKLLVFDYQIFDSHDFTNNYKRVE
jgi:hypothetical protein